MPLSHGEIDFSVAAQEITSEYIRRNPNRRYQIMIMPGLKMQGDAALLKTGLRNVIENAFIYCSEDVAAKLEIGRVGEFGIYIKDNGIGMDQVEIESILRLSSKSEGEEYAPGLSVGLAITKKIIERHGGQLEIESEPGKGTTVRFKF
jgi:Signal transduction histidine kinase